MHLNFLNPFKAIIFHLSPLSRSARALKTNKKNRRSREGNGGLVYQ